MNLPNAYPRTYLQKLLSLLPNDANLTDAGRYAMRQIASHCREIGYPLQADAWEWCEKEGVWPRNEGNRWLVTLVESDESGEELKWFAIGDTVSVCMKEVVNYRAKMVAYNAREDAQ